MNYFPMERNRYYYGKLLSVRDFQTEQNYNVSKRCLLNRTLRGGGVVCGLGVSVDSDSTMVIASGMALDYEGHEVVVEKPLLRKLQMLEGHENLGTSRDAWLTLSYREENAEPVNGPSISEGAENGAQYNIVREGYELKLTTEEPDYEALLRVLGHENVRVIYRGDECTLVLCAPSCACSGGEYVLSVLVVKKAQTPPIQFQLEGKNAFAETPEGCLLLDFHESREEKRNVYFVSFPLKVQNIRDVSMPLFPEGAVLSLELGSHSWRNRFEQDARIRLVSDEDSLEAWYHSMDSLEKRMEGANLPIYLAKLELVYSAGTPFISEATELPFGQRVFGKKEKAGKQTEVFQVEAGVRNLEYWKKPEVSTSWDAGKEKLRFDFGIPSPEQYDYTVSHGTVDILLPGGNHVDAHYCSEEIPHGLGPGTVDVRLAVEFSTEEEGSCLLIGNNEVFRKEKALPRVETAAIVYPESGTMKVGVWLHDDVRGNMIRVHYLAQRPALDSGVLTEKRSIGISVTPQMVRLGFGEQIRLKADVTGTENKEVHWNVREADGGSVDLNGIYTAPHLQGTYEVEAVSAADESVSTRAFIIVE